MKEERFVLYDTTKCMRVARRSPYGKQQGILYTIHLTYQESQHRTEFFFYSGSVFHILLDLRGLLGYILLSPRSSLFSFYSCSSELGMIWYGMEWNRNMMYKRFRHCVTNE